MHLCMVGMYALTYKKSWMIDKVAITR